MPALFAVSATTEGVTVRVQPSYAADQSDPENGHWVWHYHIRIENGDGMGIQIIDRHWVITDGRGDRRDVMGEGVVSEQPRIAPGGSFDYVSGCHFPTPSGHMQGRFGVLDSAGRRFEVEIPGFDLISPDSRRAAH
nr:Co2+/Mg2+ efflux protein ApaG [Sandaracinobacteroides hominis]